MCVHVQIDDITSGIMASPANVVKQIQQLCCNSNWGKQHNPSSEMQAVESLLIAFKNLESVFKICWLGVFILKDFVLSISLFKFIHILSFKPFLWNFLLLTRGMETAVTTSLKRIENKSYARFTMAV